MLDQINRPTSLVASFVRHPNAANLVMLLMILFGIYAIAKINTQFFPTVDRPTITVSIAWPGASAEDIEANVLAIVEPEVRFVDGVDKMASYAREGSASIVLEFDEGQDMQKALSEVETQVKAISELPEDSESPKVSRSQFFDGVAKIAISGPVSEEVLRTIAKKIRDDLVERGIDKVIFTGLRAEELQVDIAERDLRRLGLTVGDVSTVIAQSSRDLPSGNIEGVVEKQLRALADHDNASTLRSVEVRSLSSGEKVLLGDIADISSGFDSSEVIGLTEGDRSIELSIRRAPTADTLETARVLDEYIAEVKEQLPANVSLIQYEVSAERLAARIMLLVKNGLGGLILVVGILFLFLDFRVAFWVAAGIPVAMLATLGLMLASGQTINMITLFALIMMLGIIVDDAIVVGEHTYTRLQMGDDPQIAAENGIQMMILPVMAALTTTAAAFAPMLLITGTIGQIMGAMPYVVLAVILASLIECALILPGHLAHAMDGAGNRRKWSHWRQGAIALLIALAIAAIASRSFESDALSLSLPETFAAWSTQLPGWLFALIVAALAVLAAAFIEGLLYLWRQRGANKEEQDFASGSGWFRRHFEAGFAKFRDKPFNALVSLSYRWRYVTVALAIGIAIVVAAGLIRGGRVEFVFFPSPEAENIRGYVTFNAGTPEDDAIAALSQLETSLYKSAEQLGGKDELISAVFTKLGQLGRNRGDHLAEIRVQLTASEVRTVRTPDIVREWRKTAPKIPGVARFAIVEVRGGPPGRDIDVELQGGSAAILKAAASEVTDLLSSIAGVSGVSDNLPFGKPEIVMTLTPRGAALGFTIESVGRQVRNAFEGSIARRFAKGDEEITLRVSQKMRQSGSAALRNFELRSPTGEFVPLTEVVKLEQSQGFAVIQRSEGRSTISVSGDIDNDVNTTDGVIEQLTDAGELDEIANRFGITYRYGGRAEEQKDAFADLTTGTIVALAVIYIILAWVFGSYWLPIAIMLIIPFGIVGAVFGHWIMGYKLTILSVIGLLGLAGILVNDSIILVKRMIDRLKDGDNRQEAAIGASRDRLRAVLLTSLTTIGGLLPLLYETSLQAQFLLPMAITIVFGLALATLLVLFLVPSLIGIGDDVRLAVRVIFGSSDGKPEPISA